jgi:hypothetical protein
MGDRTAYAAHTVHIPCILGTRESVHTMHSLCTVWSEQRGLGCTNGCIARLPVESRPRSETVSKGDHADPSLGAFECVNGKPRLSAHAHRPSSNCRARSSGAALAAGLAPIGDRHARLWACSRQDLRRVIRRSAQRSQCSRLARRGREQPAPCEWRRRQDHGAEVCHSVHRQRPPGRDVSPGPSAARWRRGARPPAVRRARAGSWAQRRREPRLEACRRRARVGTRCLARIPTVSHRHSHNGSVHPEQNRVQDEVTSGDGTSVRFCPQTIRGEQNSSLPPRCGTRSSSIVVEYRTFPL